MKALIKEKKGPGDFVFRDIAAPAAGDDDLIIEVKAVGICGSDIRLKKSGNSKSLIPPVVIGHEFSGVVCDVGKNVKDFKIGDRVVSDNSGYLCGHCSRCAAGDYLMCENRKTLGLGLDGGCAKYVKISGDVLKVNPQTLYRIPPNVSFEEAAMLDPLANAYKAVAQESSLIPGDDIVIYGLGTIGLLAVQIAAAAGAGNIIAVNRSFSRKKFEIAKSFGATHIICSEHENTVAEIGRITGGEGVPIVIDCAGSNSIFAEAINILAKGGEFIKIGYDKSPMNISFDDYVGRGIKLIGHFAYNHTSWKNCLKLLEKGKLDLKPVISAVLPLEEWQKGFEIAESHDGLKVILQPGGR